MKTRELDAFMEAHPQPGEGPVARLRHVADVFAGTDADAFVIVATSNVYAPGERTGLTHGDIRALAALFEEAS